MRNQLFSRICLSAILISIMPIQSFSDSGTLIRDSLSATPEIFDHAVTLIGNEGSTPSLLSRYSDFEGDIPGESALQTYWYAFDDSQVGGNSVIDENYAVKNDTTKLFTPKWISGSGVSKTGTDEGTGCTIKFTLGDSIDNNGTKTSSFTGIGNDFYDSADAEYWDASLPGASAIYFQYKTTGDMEKISVELSDGSDVSDSENPGRSESIRGKNNVMHRDVLPSAKDSEGNSVWMSVRIPFDSLIYDFDGPDSDYIPLDTKKLARIQWKMKGAKGVGGTLHIDNIHLPGVTDCGCTEGYKETIMQQLKAKKNISGLSFVNNMIKFRPASDYSLKNGHLSIINTQGKTVLSTSVALTSNNQEYTVSTVNLRSGHYIVRLSGTTSGSKPVSLISRINIVN